jgi:hypothetical protein
MIFNRVDVDAPKLSEKELEQDNTVEKDCVTAPKLELIILSASRTKTVKAAVKPKACLFPM